jgi:hypothetical protein
MPLDKGQRLGPYEILALIGEGGMGEVYRARDTRLDRTVAIKIVKGHFSDRFDREARAISALNHPNICTLYDIGAEGETSYLVMEYVEGSPIRGPLAVPEALRLAIQIASALATAHANSIIHRDLKPGNILLSGGIPKLLDFGLARFAQPACKDLDATLPEPITAQGQIVGTLHYMAPEQLEGREADVRSDIFSFGVVLYELITGERPFQGASAASLMAAILKEEARPLAELQPLSPPALDRTLRKCLEKEPARRWQTAADLRDELAWIAESQPVEAPPVSRRSILPWIAGSAAAGAAASGLAAWSWLGRTPPPPARPVRFILQLPAGVWLDRLITRQTLAISPAGSELAFIGRDQKGAMIYIHRLDTLAATPVAGTEGARIVFWSPDGQTIGFYAAGKLKRIPSTGGTALPICDLMEPWTATWNSQGQIFAAASREKSALIQVDSGAVTQRKSVFWPSFLPDGKRLLYLDIDQKIRGYRAYVEEIATGRMVDLMPVDTRVYFCPTGPGESAGHLFYGRSGTLLAQPFDAARLAVMGEPVPVAEGIPYFRPAAWSEFTVSQEGTIAFTSGFASAQLTFVDRAGMQAGTVAQPQPFWGDFRISRDGTRVSAGQFDIVNGGVDTWIYDLASGAGERATFEPGVEAVSSWSPDGRSIAYGSAQSSAPQLKMKAASGQGAVQGFPPGPFQLPFDWSRDGKWILFQTSGGESDAEIWLASPSSRKLTPLLQRPFDHSQPCLSPDGRHLAFIANETGRSEVYVQRFEDGDPPGLTGERKRLSLNGGTFPRWAHGGRELFYLSLDREIMAVAFNPAGSLEFGPPVLRFKLPASFRPMAQSVGGFDVHPDGRRFLALFGKESAEHVHVIVNWRPARKS